MPPRREPQEPGTLVQPFTEGSGAGPGGLVEDLRFCAAHDRLDESDQLVATQCTRAVRRRGCRRVLERRGAARGDASSAPAQTVNDRRGGMSLAELVEELGDLGQPERALQLVHCPAVRQ